MTMQNDLAAQLIHFQYSDHNPGKFVQTDEQRFRREASPAGRIFSLQNRAVGSRGAPNVFGRHKAIAAPTGHSNFRRDPEPILRPHSRPTIKLPSSDDDALNVLDDSSNVGDPTPSHIPTSRAPIQDPQSSEVSVERKQEVTTFARGHRLSQRFIMPRNNIPKSVTAAEPSFTDIQVRHAYTPGRGMYDPPVTGTLASRTSEFQTAKTGPSRNPSFPRGSTVKPKLEEDMSTIMIRGAADLRNTKLEVEDLRREVTFLQEQLTTAERSKEESLKRVQAVKDITKKTVETSVRSLDEFKTTMDDLRTQSQESFSFANQIRTSLSDVEELRGAVADSISSMQFLLNEKGELLKVTEAKDLLAELKNDSKQSQQVSSLLRERLQTVGAELVEAKARVTEVETMQAADREALRHSASGLSATTKQVGGLSRQLKENQDRLFEVLSTAADTQAELLVAKQEASRLGEILQRKDAEIEQLRREQLEVARLQAVVSECEVKITSLQNIEQQLDIAKEKNNEQRVKISESVVAIEAKDTVISDLKTRLQQVDAAMQNSTQEQITLRERVSASQARESSYTREFEEIRGQLQSAKAKIEILETTLEESRADSASLNEKLTQANYRCQILEDRFEDQSVTLKITKEANGDLQERMMESEARFARELEAATGKSDRELAILNEQKLSLQDKVQTFDTVVLELKQAGIAARIEHDQQIKQHEWAHQAALEREREKVQMAENESRSCREKEQAKATEVLNVMNRMHDIKTQLREAQSTLSETQAKADTEILDLKLRVDQLQAENGGLNERSQTMEFRYRSGDLDSPERAFINNLVKTTQSVHEQELVTKGNDLRRRDNTILELRSKISILESTLSKHLKSQAKIHATSGVENRSLIDPATWASSDRGSSPTTGPPLLRPVSEREVNLNLTAKTPSVVRRPKHLGVPASMHATPLPPLIPAKKQLLPALKAIAAPAPPDAPAAKAPQANKPRFSNLGRDSSNQGSDIEELEPVLCRGRSPVNLGKREDRSPPSPADIETAPRPAKRLRASTRTTRSSTKPSEESELKDSDGTATKKSRRRR